MKIRWVILLFPVVSVIALSLLVKEHAAKAAAPQRAGTALSASAGNTLQRLADDS